MKKFVRKMHLGIGLAVAVPMLLVSLTGIFLAYERLEGTQDATGLATLQEGWQQALLEKGDHWMDLLAQRFPEESVGTLFLPATLESKLRIKLLGRDQNPSHVALLDFKTSSIEVESAPPLEEWVLRIHRGSWAGTGGRLWMSFSAAFMVLLWISGLQLHRYFHGRTYRKFSGRVHRRGVILGGLLAVMAISGGFLNFVKIWTDYFDPAPHEKVSQVSSTASTGLSKLPLSALLQRATEAFPPGSGRLESIRFAKRSVLFYLSDNSRVYLDPDSGGVNQVSGPSTHWIYQLYPFHSGRLLGRYSPILLIFIGLSTLALTLSGLSISGIFRRLGKKQQT